MKEPKDLIREALAKGQTALSEYDSKRFLSGFGIPVTRETLVSDLASADDAAVGIGFPVVLKAAGAQLHHKTEIGGIALGLKNRREVKKEGRRLLKIPGCEALLIQEMVKGSRELVCGLTRDPQIGPCVMFGLGGIFTELLDDVSFRIAPLTPWDAREMMREIRGRGIIGPFRGEDAVDVDMLAKTLVALGDIGLRYEDVSEIDINPLKVGTDGKPVAVDALVILKKAGR
ncbi:MAG TPA: acetate--CoA ligase family protein [Syntrophales bacterium]|jgi:acetyl-CoA synthetase (ADP-forming)|nr:acetate--CoA ligase family protein [Syntrophales bacterium]